MIEILIMVEQVLRGLNNGHKNVIVIDAIEEDDELGAWIVKVKR